jgi:hypothetical protein
VITPIPGISSVTHAEEVFTAGAVVLSEEQFRSVDELGRGLAAPSMYSPVPENAVEAVIRRAVRLKISLRRQRTA